MKIVAITGRQAEAGVRAAAGEGAKVLVADVDVAALLTPRHLEPLRPRLRGADLVLLPGYARGEFSGLEDAKTRVRLGPRHHADLPWVLEELRGGAELSATVPADVLLERRGRVRADEELDALERRARPAFRLGDLKIGGESRPKVVAEVVDAPLLDAEGLDAWLARYADADVIDIGVPLGCPPGKVGRAAEHLVGRAGKPVSVDTLDPALAEEALAAGARMVLSADRDNAPRMASLARRYDAALVVIPQDGSLASLLENLAACYELGAEKLVADPILPPAGQGAADAIARCAALHTSLPEQPLFLGCGNVTELLDADSVGANALLAALGAEVGAALLFSVEASPKTMGAVAELARATRMAYLARSRGSPPKDLGLDLLVSKEKRRRDREVSAEGAVTARRAPEQMDPRGAIKVGLADERIVARHPDATVAGDDPAAIADTVIELGLVSTMQHAAYLGRELERARQALVLCRGYVQDEPVRTGERLYRCGGRGGRPGREDGAGCDDGERGAEA